MTRRSQRRAFYALRGRPAVFCRWRCFSARRSGRLPDHAFSRRFRSPSRRLPTPLFRARPDTSGSSGHIPRRVSSRCFFPPFYSAFCFSRSFFFFGGSFFPIACRCCLRAAPRGKGLPHRRDTGSLFSYGFVFAWRGGVLLLSGYIPNLPRLSDRPVFVRFRRPASDRRAARVCRGIRPAAFDPVTTIKHSIESRERKEEGGRCYG